MKTSFGRSLRQYPTPNTTAILFCCCLCFTAKAQIADNFSDGDFTQNPVWTGDTGNFMVNAAGELQLNAAGAATSVLAAPGNIPAAVQWDLRIRLEFAPSIQNLLRIYLSADRADLANANGYFLQIGETGALDAIRLFRQTGAVKTELSAGQAGLVANSPVALHLRALRTENGEFTVLAGPDAQQLQTQFTTIDASFGGNCYAFFGFQCVNSVTNKDKFFFDDLLVNPLVPDTAPPVLQSVAAADATHLNVSFNETLDPVSATQVDHYVLDKGFGKPASVQLAPAGNAVVLTLATPLGNGNYQLQTGDIADCSGNKSAIQTGTFSFFQTAAPAPFDVVINEIMADPRPTAGLPEVEWVELFNRSNKWIDLKDLTIADNGNPPKSLPAHVLAPDSFVVLCATSSVAALKAINNNIVGIGSFPSLNDAGDAVILGAASGATIDRIDYLVDWHTDAGKKEGGWSLERINPGAFCLDAANWKSATGSGGSPGRQNTVFSSVLTPLSLSSVLADSDTRLTVTFNQALDPVSAANPGHYSLNGGAASIASAQPGATPYIVLLTTATPLVNGNYRLSTQNIADCSGSIAGTTAFDFVYIKTEAAAEFDVLINEFMADPSPSVGLPEVEWIELFNRSNKWIDLKTLTISDGSGSPQALPSYLLAPDSFVVLCTPAGAPLLTPFSTRVLGVSGLPSLNNTGDLLILGDASGHTIDRVDFSLDWHTDSGKKDGGWSLERANPNSPCLGAANWKSAARQPGGTPGQQNSVYDTTPDTEVPRLTDAFPVDASQIRVYFSEGMDLNSVQNAAAYQFSPARGVRSASLSLENRTTVLLNLTEPLSPGTVYYLTMQGQVQDCSGNVVASTDSVRIGLPEKPAPQDIVVNEILFNPPTGGVRYVEFYNRSQKIFSGEDLFMANFVESDVIKIGVRRLFLPGAYVVFSTDPDDIIQRYARIFPERIVPFDLPSLADDQGNISIYWSKNGETVMLDSFDYDEKYHNALYNDSQRDGVALERIDPDGPTNSAANWTSAASSVTGAPGTPTLPNSQRRSSAAGSSALIDLPVGRLSPDGDNREDFLEIRYQVAAPGYAAAIRIFDSEGLPVRQLVRQELVGTEGFLRWDGEMDDGTPARPGIYILSAELFAPGGKVERVKKAFALVRQF